MREAIIFSGSGGQGIMFMGKIFALAALKSGFNVTLLPAYGAEVRGGTSHCMVIVSGQEIASPFVNSADTVIAMNEPSLNKFTKRLKDKSLLIVNSSMVENRPQIKNSRLVFLPFSDLAANLKDIRVANMFALGAYIAGQKTVSLKNVIEALRESIPAAKKDLFLLNEKAIKEGIRQIQSEASKNA